MTPSSKPRVKPRQLKTIHFIFSNAIIMPGVTIGEGAIVLPGSVVTKNVEAMEYCRRKSGSLY